MGMLLSKEVGDNTTWIVEVFNTRWARCTQKVEKHNDVILWEGYTTESELKNLIAEGYIVSPHFIK